MTLCESPVMPNWPHAHRASCPAEDQRHYHYQTCDFYSSNFGLTCDHVTEAVATNMETAGFRGRYLVLLGTFGTRCGERKGMSLLCLFFLLSETVAPLLLLLKHSGIRWCHPKISLFRGSTIYSELIFYTSSYFRN